MRAAWNLSKGHARDMQVPSRLGERSSSGGAMANLRAHIHTIYITHMITCVARLCFQHLCLPFRPLPYLTWPIVQRGGGVQGPKPLAEPGQGPTRGGGRVAPGGGPRGTI